MRKFFAIFLCLTFPLTALAGDNGYKIAYDGGSLQNAKAGTAMRLQIDGTNIRIIKDKTEIVVIPAAGITEISYGQDVHRRVGAAIGVAVVSLALAPYSLFPNQKNTTSGSPGTIQAERAASHLKQIRTTIADFSRDSKESQAKRPLILTQ